MQKSTDRKLSGAMEPVPRTLEGQKTRMWAWMFQHIEDFAEENIDTYCTQFLAAGYNTLKALGHCLEGWDGEEELIAMVTLKAHRKLLVTALVRHEMLREDCEVSKKYLLPHCARPSTGARAIDAGASRASISSTSTDYHSLLSQHVAVSRPVDCSASASVYASDESKGATAASDIKVKQEALLILKAPSPLSIHSENELKNSQDEPETPQIVPCESVDVSAQPKTIDSTLTREPDKCSKTMPELVLEGLRGERTTQKRQQLHAQGTEATSTHKRSRVSPHPIPAKILSRPARREPGSSSSAFNDQSSSSDEERGGSSPRVLTNLVLSKGDVSKLSTAIESGDVDAIGMILQARPGTINGQVERGASLLHLAAKFGHLPLLQLFKDKGLSLEAGDGRLCTSLHWAAYFDRPLAVQWLLDQGADPEARDCKCGETPLLVAATAGHTQCLTVLLRCSNKLARNKSGRSALHLAAFHNRLEPMRLLMEAEVPVDYRDESDQTPLHWAACKGSVEAVQLLLEKGASVVAQENKLRRTALHFAAEAGHGSIVQRLLQSGADLTLPDENHWLPLHLAASGGHVDCVTALLEHGADVDCLDENRWTPLHCAVHYDHVDMVQLLVSKGANVNARSTMGELPNKLAQGPHRREIASFLRGKRKAAASVPIDLCGTL